MRPGEVFSTASATVRRALAIVALGMPLALHAQDLNASDNLSNLTNATASAAFATPDVSAAVPGIVSFPADWVSLAAIAIVLGVTAYYLIKKRY